VVAILAVALGYHLGLRVALNGVPHAAASVPPTTPKSAKKTRFAGMSESGSGSEDEESSAGLSSIKAGPSEECKLVLVVRSDLGMTKGKIAAQCSHATLACYKALLKSNPALLKHWEHTGQAKIALRCDSEEELLLLQATAQSLNLCTNSIQDAGRTQIVAGSTTALGIGPAPVKLVNQVTGHLKLL